MVAGCQSVTDLIDIVRDFQIVVGELWTDFHAVVVHWFQIDLACPRWAQQDWSSFQVLAWVEEIF